MKKHTLVLVVLALVVVFVAFWVVGNRKANAPTEKTPATSTSSTNSTSSTAETNTADCPVSEQPTITYQNDSFSPSCVTVKSGTVVTWVNKSSQGIELGADPHPTHTGNRDVTNGEFTLPIAAGAQATSTLKAAGNHGYHNHLSPDATGRIVVQ